MGAALAALGVLALLLNGVDALEVSFDRCSLLFLQLFPLFLLLLVVVLVRLLGLHQPFLFTGLRLLLDDWLLDHSIRIGLLDLNLDLRLIFPNRE